MTYVRSIPAALKIGRFLPLLPGTKQPASKHAVLDQSAPWSPDIDRFLEIGENRVGAFMGGTFVVLDADVKWAWEDDGNGHQVQVKIRDGADDIARLCAAAGLGELPRTLKIRTQGGGTHWYFFVNGEVPVSQKRIGNLDVRSNPNAYCAIGHGYEILDDPGTELAVLPTALAMVIMHTPDSVLEAAGQNGHREGTYGNAATAFNNALTVAKGKIVELGWPEEQANQAIVALNNASDDPMDARRLESTVLKIKGWQPGERVSDSLVEWAKEQTGLSPTEDDRLLDIQTIKRLWTTERYKALQELAALDPPSRETMADVLAEPPPPWVMSGMLTQGLYGLAGPQEAGKSLLVRDWANAVANGTAWNSFQVTPAEVTYVISEGHFDLAERFMGIRTDDIYIYRQPVQLNNERAVEVFMNQHEGHETGLIIFDIIYHMGIVDDNTMKDVRPVLQACRKISSELGCAVVIVGHPGHNNARRFRGTSIWRNWFDGEFHMANDVLSCEKHKFARKEHLEWSYEIEWPRIRLLSEAGAMSLEAKKMRIFDEIQANPTESARALALRLAPVFDCTPENVRKMIANVKKVLGG